MDPKLAKIINMLQISKKIDKIESALDNLEKDTDLRTNNPAEFTDRLDVLAKLTNLYEQGIKNYMIEV